MAADIIMPSHPYQSEIYPEEEWAWRGIVDPSLARCGSPREELIFNYSFKCSDSNWTENNATAIYDGITAAVTRTGASGQIYQEVNLEAGEDYYIDTSITATTSSGFVNIVAPSSSSTYPIDFIGVGEHTVMYNATETGTHTIGVGVNSPDGSTATFDWLSLHKLALTETPCMTSEDTPYGLVETSSEFSSLYSAYEGMNCYTNANNCWISAVHAAASVPDDGTARGDWLQWKLTDMNISDGMPEMIPTSIQITPRGGMNSSWYLDRNPKGLAIFGIKTDNSLQEIFRDDDLPDWNNSATREFVFTTQSKFKGFRVYITKVNYETSNNSYNTAIGTLKMFGAYPILTTDSGEPLETDTGEELWA